MTKTTIEVEMEKHLERVFNGNDGNGNNGFVPSSEVLIHIAREIVLSLQDLKRAKKGKVPSFTTISTECYFF
jgi:hypothetical protein